MPELPEVQTTVNYLKREISGLSIKDVWSCYDSPFYKNKENIKDKNYFKKMKKEVRGRTISDVERKGKNILIHLSGDVTILIHMKMTGHLLYGEYRRTNRKEKRVTFENWIAVKKGPMRDDPFNRFIRLVFTLSNGLHLVLSDARKFATVFIYNTKDPPVSLMKLGPDPLQKNFTFKKFLECFPFLVGKQIKQTLLEQTVISGIGNIYSDEILWSAGVHPESSIEAIPQKKLYKIFSSMKFILHQGIDLGGNSVSDYRKPDGKKGSYQYRHKAYQKKGRKCSRRNCNGTIVRRMIKGRSTFFCCEHQILYNSK